LRQATDDIVTARQLLDQAASIFQGLGPFDENPPASKPLAPHSIAARQWDWQWVADDSFCHQCDSDLGSHLAWAP
jgi:hypothetical protein